MKSWVLKSFGYENFKFEDFDNPKLTDDEEIIVKVLACGVCFRDLIDIQGGFPYTIFPTIPGHEIAGEVVDVGTKTPFKKGDYVASRHGPFCGRCELCLSGRDNLCKRAGRFVHTQPGGYAPLVKSHYSAFFSMPSFLNPEQAAIVFCAIGTAFRGLIRANFKPSDVVVVTGASGGVGIHTIQIVKALSGSVIAITSSKGKSETLKELGADEVIVSQDLNFHKNVLSKGGADIVIETTGSAGLPSAMKSLKDGGRLVVIGNIKLDKFESNPGLIILKEMEIFGSVGATSSDLQKLIPLLEKKIKPIIHSTFKLEDALIAHQKLKSREVIGRLALIP